jgi:hypothetical protein
MSNSVLHEGLASDLALIDKVGQFGPAKQRPQGDKTSVRGAIKRLTELAQQSGSESDIDALRTILAAAQLQPMRECVTLLRGESRKRKRSNFSATTSTAAAV